ncbi:cysteine dioxygenase [Trujillonella endophytica]|uniref:Cysteine dioxygenase type I n=1 Tax=Trujillonella endophytica TaxID=673521 RepID=A0A1H8PAU9_9ACTN|nr:cysteine dioxygenase family protein [Trujillella endophytica]SEO39070.1 Cysteine dioxygenase type I [Trujillella endophytica]
MPSPAVLSPAPALAAPTGTATRPRPSLVPPIRRAGVPALAAALAAAADRWLHLVEYRPDSRWTHLLPSADAAAVLDPSLHRELAAAEVWLLSWLPGQGTPLHDHGRSAGAFAVVRGSLTERVVAPGRPGRPGRESTAELTGGSVRSFGAHYVHQVTNSAPVPAISVHVYAPRLTEMNTYSFAGDRLDRTGTEQAGVDW